MKKFIALASVITLLVSCGKSNDKGELVGVKGKKWHHSLLDYSIYQYEWRLDEQERKVPFVFNTDSNMWIKINNLHIHSKQLADCLSKQLY